MISLQNGELQMWKDARQGFTTFDFYVLGEL